MLKDGAFEGKTVLVTGGGSGLGRAMATYMAQLGANIIITSRNLEKIEKAAKEMEEESGGKVLAVQGDVRNYEEMENVLAKGVETFGAVHCLLNNAAGNFVSPTERLSHRAFESVIGIVLQGSANCSLILGKYWIKNNIQGTILNITTTYTITGSAFVVPSACAKAGVEAMTKSLAIEWGRKYKIRVNAISPGPFPTEGAWKRLMPGDLAERLKPERRIPMGRVGDHQELANLAAYLLSDYSSYINGETVVIDGGEWLQSGGEFNDLHIVTDEMWDMLAAMRSKK